MSAEICSQPPSPRMSKPTTPSSDEANIGHAASFCRSTYNLPSYRHGTKSRRDDSRPYLPVAMEPVEETRTRRNRVHDKLDEHVPAQRNKAKQSCVGTHPSLFVQYSSFAAIDYDASTAPESRHAAAAAVHNVCCCGIPTRVFALPLFHDSRAPPPPRCTSWPRWMS